ncbi:MAG: TRAP transporter small permease [Betaproteobacteria bacterium]|nr:TRAP transporter small permease [Betaproteobacteria bacterium]
MIERLAQGAGYLASLVLFGIVGLTMVEVVTRYVLHNPMILSDEFGGYALVAISFLGLAYCSVERGHIRITFIVERLSPLMAGRMRVLTLALGLVFVAVAAWVSWKFLGDSFARNMRSNSLLMTPLKWPQMAIPIGFTLFALVLAAQLAHAIGELRAGRVVDQFTAEEF